MSNLYKIADILGVPIEVYKEGLYCPIAKITISPIQIDVDYRVPAEIKEVQIHIDIKLDS